MVSRPAWLPNEISFAEYGNNWDEYLEAVYNVFQSEIKDNTLEYQGRGIIFDTHIEYGKEAGFWHLISRDNRDVDERLPEIRRCEKITWIRPIIENCGEEGISVWKKEIKRQTRIHIWFEEMDYIIVLAEMKNVNVLVTAFCTDIESYKKKLRKDRARYTEMQKPPRGTT